MRVNLIRKPINKAVFRPAWPRAHGTLGPMRKQKRSSSCVIALRCSPEQRVELERRASGQQIGVYLRAALFPANDNSPPPKRVRAPSKKTVALAKGLALLGQVATQLRDQARAAELAGLPPENEPSLADIERQLAEIKSLFMKGLGVRER